VPNITPQTARDLGAVVHVVQPTLTIVPGHEDAFFTLTVPAEVVAGAGDEVLDFSGLFQHTEGPGISMEVRDAAGNLLGSGERFRVRAPQGSVLTLHVFALTDATGTRGAGAYTLDIAVLPQVVSVESQPLLPGTGASPGGPTASLVITFQADRLEPTTAENPANYRVTWLGPDELAGTADDQVIPINCGTTGSQCVVYDPSANVDVASGRTFPTAVRQTVTLLFDLALPAGSYEIELSPAIQTAAFSEEEAGLLSDRPGFTGHPVVSASGGTIVEGSRQTAVDLVLAAGALGDFGVFKTGTRFLTQLHDDLGALLDGRLTAQGDAPTITAGLIDHILSRFDPALGAPGARPTSLLVIWIDPGSIDLEDPDGDEIVYDSDADTLETDIDDGYVDVTGNVEVIVVANASGTFQLGVSDLSATARGGVVVLGTTGNQTQNLTNGLRSGTTSFTISV
jgi:hypothetical protein